MDRDSYKLRFIMGYLRSQLPAQSPLVYPERAPDDSQHVRVVLAPAQQGAPLVRGTYCNKGEMKDFCNHLLKQAGHA